MSDSDVAAAITPRIHYASRSRYEQQWTWPVDSSPVFGCEFQPRQPPLYQRTTKRLRHSLREHTSALDEVTCRDCRRSEAFQEDHRNRERRNNDVPRHFRYWGSKRKRRQIRAESYNTRYVRHHAEQERLAVVEAAKRPPVAMWRTRAARQQPCPCPMHTKAHDKRTALDTAARHDD